MLVYIIILFIVLHIYIVWHLSGTQNYSTVTRIMWFIACLIPPLFYLFLIKLAFFSTPRGSSAAQPESATQKHLLEPFDNL